MRKPFIASYVMSAGQLLCGGLFSQDGLTAWFAAIALFHSIHHNHALKKSLLQVHMAPSSGSGPPVTLMQQCFRLICQVRSVFEITANPVPAMKGIRGEGYSVFIRTRMFGHLKPILVGSL